MSLTSGLIPDFIKNAFSDKAEERCMYVFRTSQLVARIKVNCSGNVDSAPLRETIALRMGYEIIKKLEDGGHAAVSSINNDKDHALERKVSAYIKSGKWAWQAVTTDEDARDFYRYASDHLNPLLQSHKKSGKTFRANIYSQWLEDLKKFKKISCNDLDDLDYSTVAVGVFYHTTLPEDFR